MKLAYWMYAGPAHIGTLRTASSFKSVQSIMHGPLGDDYFNVMRSMLERERDFTPVTTSVVDRHVLARGSQEKVFENITRKDKEANPDLIILTPTCTSSILQEDLQNFVNRAALEAKSADVLLADVNHYRVNELQAADRTLEQIVRYYIEKYGSDTEKTKKPSVNIIGVFTLGFHNTHDCRELKRILYDLNIDINIVIPEGNSVLKDLKKLPKAWLNIVPYREVGLMTAKYLESAFNMPYVSTTPMGILETANFIREVTHNIQEIQSNSMAEKHEYKKSIEEYIDQQTRFVSQAAWFSRSIDCQNLTGKKAIVFGDATHAASMTKILVREMGIRVACAGTYCKHDADWFREQTAGYCDSILITESHNEVANSITEVGPSAIFGTAPVHIQNFTLGYRPFLGFEGTNQIADLKTMESHLLEIFSGHDTKEISSKETKENNLWSQEASTELNKVPGPFRGKVKRMVEKYAQENNISSILVETMYAAREESQA
uniref:ChlB subunit of protochlorophyllide reductase n=1 Tax=Cephaleuros diffusus TaxID=1519597 RepID=UPI0030010842